MCESPGIGYENYLKILRDMGRLRMIEGNYVRGGVAVPIEGAREKAKVIGVSPLEFMAIGSESSGVEGIHAVMHNGNRYKVIVGPNIELGGIHYGTILGIRRD